MKSALGRQMLRAGQDSDQRPSRRGRFPQALPQVRNLRNSRKYRILGAVLSAGSLPVHGRSTLRVPLITGEMGACSAGWDGALALYLQAHRRSGARALTLLGPARVSSFKKRKFYLP